MYAPLIKRVDDATFQLIYVTFLYAVEKKLLNITYEKQEEILLSPITKPPRNFNVYSII